MSRSIVFFTCALLGACGGDSKQQPKPDAGGPLFPPVPECQGDSIVALHGTSPQVISKLAIGTKDDGFDLDGDGNPDNKLGGVSGIAQSSIDSAFKNDEVIIPIEFFDAPAAAADDCIKFAIYLGKFADADGDGSVVTKPGGDCDDNRSTVHPGATEDPANGIDDNCDGTTDEGGTDGGDNKDGDGFTVAQGDCDDTDKNVYPGAPEICGDGKDNDCDGLADSSMDASGNVIACSPFDGTAEIPLDPLSLDSTDATKPVISFTSGKISSDLKLTAGPSIFQVSLPLSGDINLTLKITGAQIKADVVPNANGVGFTLKNGHLGGVLDAKTIDTIRGLSVDQIGLTPENSLLDAMFANVLGPLIALPKSTNPAVMAAHPDCRTPDIDVDRDGLESFCESNPDRDVRFVDICVDGDGTEVDDVVDGSGVTTMQCTEAKTADGKDRFVDGVSVELNFETTALSKIDAPAAVTKR